MKNCVYVLRSKNSGKFYVGSTKDLDNRLKQHNNGSTHTTRRFGEIELVFCQNFDSLAEARAIERKIKSWKRKDFIEKIIEDGKINFRISPHSSMDRIPPS